jgi:subtilase family serine protease
MNFKKNILIICVLLMFGANAGAQDLSVDSVSISHSTKGTIATIGIKNSGTTSINANPVVYVTLQNKAIAVIILAQLELQAPPLQPNATHFFYVNFNSFKMINGFTLNQATHLLVFCDAKNEINERNENNNVKAVALSNLKTKKH